MAVKLVKWICYKCGKEYPPFRPDGSKTKCEPCENKPKSFMERLWMKILDKL